MTQPDQGLKARLDALSEGATSGKWCQFHPAYTPEAEGTAFTDWDTSHNMSAVKDGNRKKMATWTHANDAHFAETLVNALRANQLITLPDHLAAVKAAVDAEREACALIGRAAVNECREMEETDLRSVREHVAAAIRARANGGE